MAITKPTSPFKTIIVGLVIMIGGIFLSTNIHIEALILFIGTLVAFTGLIQTVRKTYGTETKKKKKQKDNPTILRLIGVGVALFSLTLPYTKTGFGTGPNTEAVTLEIIQSFYTGITTEISLVLLTLVAVIIAGAFISIFHHVGGYMILLASSTFAVISFYTTKNLNQFANDFESGLLLVLFASIIIILSSLIKPKAGLDHSSDWRRKTG